jgi:hypothetical protein
MEKHICTECEKEFKTARGLEMHMKVHNARKERVPFYRRNQKLKTEEITGKVQRVVNDVGDRISGMLEGGWEHVPDGTKMGEGEDTNTDLGSMVSKRVGEDKRGNDIIGYKMMIDKDLYDADQREKQDKIDKTDVMIRSGTFNNKTTQRHDPSVGISIETK